MKEVAQTKGYAFIFDLASGTSVLYASDKNDVSDDVLDQLGNVMQTVRRENRRKTSNVAGSTTGTKSSATGTIGTNSGTKGINTGSKNESKTNKVETKTGGGGETKMEKKKN